jgi:hypothetical protein
MRRRTTAAEPLCIIELLKLSQALKRTPEVGRRLVEEHREQLAAHADGMPCRHGHDGREIAARLLKGHPL